MINCDCKRIKNPSGIWEYTDLIGSKVYIKSMPVSGFFDIQSGVVCTISDIYFRVSIDGKVITLVALKELPGKVFTWKDLMIDTIVVTNKDDAVCGVFLCGNSVVGNNVDTTPSYIGDLSGGISILDEQGNIISGRKIRFIGATVENIATDPDDVTDISVDPINKISGGTF